MANTKQMQTRAKQRKVLQQAEAIRIDLEQKICISKNDTFILPAGPKMLGTMLGDFRDAYANMGDTCNLDGSAEQFFIDGRKVFIISYKGEVAGFMSLSSVKTGNGKEVWDDATLVEIVYVKPKFRGLNLSSVMYRYAIENHNAEGVELSYQRITGKEAYWAAIGFNRICLMPYQKGTKQALAIISKNPLVGVALTSSNVRTIRSVCNTTDTSVSNLDTVMRKISKKMETI
jgi:GNAT superfamily N-acetyltransferase